MTDLKRARMFTLFAVAALATVSFSAIALSDNDVAGDVTYVSNFSDLKSALDRGDKMITMTDDITLKDSIIIREGQRLIIQTKATLTIPENRELCNFGHIMVGGKITNKGVILQSGDKGDQIILPNGSLEGTLMLDLPEISLAQTGETEFTFPYLTGVNGDTVNITVNTSSAAPGEYTFDTTLSEGKYTTSYDNGDNKYSCKTHTGGKFTIVSNSPSEGAETADSLSVLIDFLNHWPQGTVRVIASFDVDQPITIDKDQEVEIDAGVTMTITDTGSICNEGAFCNHGTLVTNGNFYQKQYRYSAFYNFGTVTGEVGLSYDDIGTLYRHVDMYDIRVFPTYDIYHPIVLNCTPYDTEGTSFTYTDKANPGQGEYKIEIVNDHSEFDYFIHDAGKLILDKYDLGPDPEPGPSGISDNGLILIVSAAAAFTVLIVALAVIAVKKK